MRHDTILEGELIRLRPFEPTDLEPYRAWVNDPEVMALADRSGPVGAEEHVRWYQRLLDAPDVVVFAVEERAAHAYVGNIWLHDVDRRHRRAEVRIILGPPAARERGLGSAAIAELARHAFGPLGLEKLYAYVLAHNPRARRAFERAGFRIEATLRKDRVAARGRIDVWRLAAFAPGVEDVA